MSIIDKVIAAVTPPESDEARRAAREKARSMAGKNDWLTIVLQHHEQIEAAFALVRSAGDAASRRAAQQRLELMLTGHSIAEEAVLYPALVKAGEKGRSTMGYTEQSAVKIQLGLLEDLDPLSQEYLDKLEHIRGAVAHHVYQEEGTWFPELIEKLPVVTHEKLTRRYIEEFDRYMGSGSVPAAARAPSRASVELNTRGEFSEQARGGA